VTENQMIPRTDRPGTDEILTVAEVADRLRMKCSWVYAHADELGAFKLGKYRRFSWQRVLERLNRAVEVGSVAQRPSGGPAASGG